MTTITLKTTEEEKKILKEYAKFNGMSLNQYIKQSMLEKIEDEYDYKVAESAYEEFVNNGEKATPFEELLKSYGI